MKNLKFGVLAFGVLGLIACFLPLAKMGDVSISLWDAHKGAAAMVYGTMVGFALAAVAGVLGAVKPPFGKPQAGIALVGFIVAGVGIQFVFLTFAAVAVIGGLTVAKFGVETKGRVLEELSP